MVKLSSSPARLEAFSDGVIAVIITIMVLELKVPHQDGLAGLISVLPTLGVYGLSFAFTGIYWINHHHLVHRTDEADQSILYANLAFLFCLSLLPFFTSYLIDKKIDSFSVALYAVSMAVTGFSFLLLRLAIGTRLRRSGALEAEDKAAETKHLVSLAMYGIEAPLAFYRPHWALLSSLSSRSSGSTLPSTFTTNRNTSHSPKTTHETPLPLITAERYSSLWHLFSHGDSTLRGCLC